MFDKKTLDEYEKIAQAVPLKQWCPDKNEVYENSIDYWYITKAGDEKTAEFIAHFDPQTILSMIRELRKLIA